MKRALLWGLGTLLVLFLLACAGMQVPLDLAVAALFGWATFLARNAPQWRVDWSGVTTAAVAVLGFVGVAHGLGRSLLATRTWRPRWTAGLALASLLLFVSGLCAVGVAHQLGWFFSRQGPWTQSNLEGFQRIETRNDLSIIGLALHQYHEDLTALPPGGTFDASGRPLHSWQTHLLPYVERADLYQTIDLSLAWDDPQNQTSFGTSVKEFADYYRLPPPRRDQPALTNYAANGRVLAANRSLRFEEIADGLSSTFLAGEVSENFRPWGDPRNMRDPALGINKSPDGFGRGPETGGAHMLLVDGSVRFVGEQIDARVLRVLATPNGGEEIDENAW